jgi:cell division protein FtsB
MLLFIVFGENGLTDLYKLKMEKDNLLKKNDELKKENLSLYREIERLKNDPGYVEDVARKELGVIGKDEVIIKIKPKPSVSNSDRNIKKRKVQKN